MRTRDAGRFALMPKKRLIASSARNSTIQVRPGRNRDHCEREGVGSRGGGCAPGVLGPSGTSAMQTASGPLLLDRQLGRGDRLQPSIGNRKSTLEREPVRTRREPLLGALDRRELVTQVLRTAFVQLVLVELDGLVAGVALVVVPVGFVAFKLGELP